ncbi:DNA starvation/stationary phase protection protein [Xylanibacillus composti]|uniref:General stress protein 20U n=1 Tax=Xylanibacillus composti TaxID=1572762 RepID=A0A8J4H1I7_9BACL|nr:Dps family protein [Xylanibacillus composti]MDT9725819.1 DNA starvation/stationary phase protection protein [Xylanibacillus composti]GIQ69227.1 general stress protein 20U [Xylanibacillus composti]
MTTEMLTQTDAQAANLTKVLNKQVANWTVLYTKLHNYHWFVKGSDFFTLHAKFEELYTEGAGYLDELAERILTLGGSPVATLKEALAVASIQEANGGESAAQMVESVFADFGTLISELNDGIAIAEENHDDATADMLLGIRQSLEKHNWMFRAYLGK